MPSFKVVIELTCISQYPIPQNAKSISKYIPMRIFQKKIFVVENMQIEEHVDSKGATIKQFTTCKYDTEYYKINMPYKELRDKYFTPIVIKGLHNE